MPIPPIINTISPAWDLLMVAYLTLGMGFALWQRHRQHTQPLERSLFDVGCLVLLIWQLSTTILLLLGWYNIWAQGIVLSAPWLIGWRTGLSTTHPSQTPSVRSTTFSTVDYGLYGLLLLTCMGYLWFASPPPWMRDSLTYHLALAKQYAIAGAYVKTDLVVFSFFPQGWQSILTLIHSPLDGHYLFNPRYLNVCISMLISAGIIGFLKQQKMPTTWSITAGLLYLFTPTVFEFGTSCYVQPWLTMGMLWLGISLYEKRSLWIIGGLTGLLCSVKYSALVIPCILGLSLTIEYQSTLKKTLPYWGMLILIGTPFYIRNFWLTGNPTFPLLFSIFGGEGWDPWRAMAYDITLQNYGAGRSLMDYILLPWRLFTTREMVGEFQGSLGPVWAVLTIFSLRQTSYLRWFIIGWSVFWALQVQQVRFFVPILPIILILSMTNIKLFTKHAWIGLLTISTIWSATLYAPLNTQQQTHAYWSAVPTDTLNENQLFLTHRLPENYPVYQYLNDVNVTKVWLVWMRGYHYYLQQPARIDNVFGAYRFEQLLHEASPKVIYERLQQESISHVAINWRFFLVDSNADRLGDGATEFLKSQFAEMIQNKYLIPTKQWGPVWIYEVSESDSESMSPNESIE